MKRWYTRIGAMKHLRANEPNLPIAPTSPLQKTRERLGELLGSRIARLGRGEEDQVRPGYGERAGAGSLRFERLRTTALPKRLAAAKATRPEPPSHSPSHITMRTNGWLTRRPCLNTRSKSNRDLMVLIRRRAPATRR